MTEDLPYRISIRADQQRPWVLEVRDHAGEWQKYYYCWKTDCEADLDLVAAEFRRFRKTADWRWWRVVRRLFRVDRGGSRSGEAVADAT